MQVSTATGGAQRPPEGTLDEGALEDVASELLYPLTVIKLNAQELLSQFQDGPEDATAVDAAQTLLRSVERMSHILQVLVEGTQAAQSSGRAGREGRDLHSLVG